ncbi:DUF2868 domain-containing protein [Sphaerotilus sp.]|uniref:DUF2868 domain-containing protein n=1 Tax=Sphaerotilus sp. TaxID=2093942 RepID=UPI002ACD726D|nr:DUF2868 domain-containing protein [Sphaerotilus sp.]MDZ7859026.1 DUF2868 domain-containing protein [Sphaerotilus sp.]
MDESTARQVLLIQAFETAGSDHPLWTADDRRWATRVALEGADPAARADRFIAVRADAAVRRLAPRAAPVAHWLAHRLWHRRWAVAALLLGVVLGFVVDTVGAGHRVNLLGTGVWGLVAWNLLVYVLLVLPVPDGWLRRALSRRMLDLRGLLRGARQEPVFERVAQTWAAASAPLSLARAGVLMHLGAAGLALGVIGGLYLRGIGLDYRAGWASTFLDAAAVHQVLGALYWPAQQALHALQWLPFVVSPIALPDLAGFEALRLVGGESPAATPASSAAPWIHLQSLTLAMLVVVPRLALAALGGLRALWWSKRFPLRLEGEAYFDDLLRQQRREQARVTLLPYAQDAASPAEHEALRQWLQPLLGETLQWQVMPVRPYGSEDEVALQQSLVGRPTLLLARFDLSATPESEVHGRWLRALQTATRQAGAPKGVLVLEEGSFVQRFGQSAPERVAQRRAAWQALGGEVGMAVLSVHAGVPVEPSAAALRRQLDGAAA